MLQFDATGRYVGTINYANSKMYEEARKTGVFFAPEFGDEYYWDLELGEIRQRPVMEIQVTKFEPKVGEVVTLSSMPDGATVKIDDEDIEWVEGEVELTSDTRDHFKIEVALWPFMPFQAAVVFQ